MYIHRYIITYITYKCFEQVVLDNIALQLENLHIYAYIRYTHILEQGMLDEIAQQLDNLPTHVTKAAKMVGLSTSERLMTHFGSPHKGLVTQGGATRTPTRLKSTSQSKASNLYRQMEAQVCMCVCVYVAY
jgi:hypothetical protein